MRWAGRESGIVCPAIFSWKFDQSINGQERETFEENAFERWGMESMDGGAIGEEEKLAKVLMTCDPGIYICRCNNN